MEGPGGLHCTSGSGRERFLVGQWVEGRSKTGVRIFA